MTTYKPGTVAVATVRGVPNVRVMAGYGTAEPRLRWVTTDERLVDETNEGWWFSYQVTDVRPLVVLDLSADDLRDAASCIQGHTARNCAVVERIANQIEAQTRPPKPEEPTGLGAVVEDSEGRRWVRVDRGLYPWESADDAGGMAYRHLNAVRILSEGVRP